MLFPSISGEQGTKILFVCESTENIADKCVTKFTETSSLHVSWFEWELPTII